MLKPFIILLAFLFELTVPEIHVGGAINIFRFYGDLGVIMRVVPRSDPHWFLREPTVDIFDEVLETRSTPVQLENEVLNGDFQMEFCDNLAQLKEAYFRGFKIDGSDCPWCAFTGGWSSFAMSKRFGLNVTYVTNHHAYVLVRVSRHRELIRMTPYPGIKVNNWTSERVKEVKNGDMLSVMDFIHNLGSHFIASYATGNSLYQIIAYKPEVYLQMKQRLMTLGVDSLGIGQANGYFTPFYADHMGSILAVSGNGTLEAWAERNLQSTMYVILYYSLLNLHSSPSLLRELNELLENEALLELELRTLAPLFQEEGQRKWFEEVMSNHLRLWEVNV